MLDNAPAALAEVVLRGRSPAPPPENSPYSLPTDAMNRMIASLSPDDTAAALRLLKVLEECRQMDSRDAEKWRRWTHVMPRSGGGSWGGRGGGAASPVRLSRPERA